MKDVVKSFKKIIYLSFPPDVSGRPMMCNLARLFDLNFNILKANINPRQEGAMTLEITGLEEDFHKGVGYLKENGIRVISIAQKIFRDEDSCINCGVCTAMCPTKALALDKSTRLISFDVEKCSACGLCTRVCPVHAMTVDLDENGISK